MPSPQTFSDLQEYKIQNAAFGDHASGRGGPRRTDYIDVPYADIRYPPVSLYEIKAARALLRAQGKKRIQQH
jgi:hypothetical protein